MAMHQQHGKRGLQSPMLAHTFSGAFPSEPMFSQPKLDGVRCLATSGGLWSRSGRKITSCQHIESELATFFERHPDVILDGELFNEGLDFSSIVSQVNRRFPGDPWGRAEEDKVQLNIFDSVDLASCFSDRWARLTSLLRPISARSTSLRLVETHPVCSQAYLDALFAQYLASGLEGQMIRLDRPYECRRSGALLKRKPIQDDEFVIERVDRGARGLQAYVKRVVLRTATGRVFAANVAGGQQVEEQLLTTRYHSATVRYQGLTSGGVPRFPTAVAFHTMTRDL